MSVAIVLLCCIAPFFIVFLTGVILPPQFASTWYGALAPMYDRIESAQGNKIIIVGNSNVAFGVDSALAEELLHEGGLDYGVYNFGLYGSLGTKMMLELVRGRIEEGDIIVLVPELAEQPLSTYFSAQEAWYALDGDMSMFWAFSGDEQGALAGAYASYTAEKLQYANSGTPAQGSGVYASSSFDGRGDLNNYDRSNNIMSGGYDINNMISLDASLFSPDFVSYVNEYARVVQNKGAAMYFSFPPINARALTGGTSALEFQSAVAQLLSFPVISDVRNYIMDYEWFYDSNFHLNSSGMTVRTVQLVNDIKNQLGNTTKTEVTLPNKPAVPQEGVEGEGDNSCAGYFTYQLSNGYYIITGLTEEGRARTELVIPYQVDGIYIASFTAEAFAGAAALVSVTVQDNISVLPDGAFSGCTALREIRLMHESPADISVGYGLFEGTSGACCVYVSQSAYSQFTNNYFWGRYADRIKAY